MRTPRVATAMFGPLVLWATAQLGCSAFRVERSSAVLAQADPMETREAYAVVQYAAAQVGKRYCWGGTGPACFDCSGLVQTAWASVGVRLPRTADAIAAELPEVSVEQDEISQARKIRAGDILWWPGHVGLYAGNGWVVEALDRRHGVILRPMTRPPHRAFRPSG